DEPTHQSDKCRHADGGSDILHAAVVWPTALSSDTIAVTTSSHERVSEMVERRSELKRRYHRKKKMAKLKKKLETVTVESKKTKPLYKIHCISPEWKPAEK